MSSFWKKILKSGNLKSSKCLVLICMILQSIPLKMLYKTVYLLRYTSKYEFIIRDIIFYKDIYSRTCAKNVKPL